MYLTDMMIQAFSSSDEISVPSEAWIIFDLM
jgi:hypothetical protein